MHVANLVDWEVPTSYTLHAEAHPSIQQVIGKRVTVDGAFSTGGRWNESLPTCPPVLLIVEAH